jgi:hypothetical protein
VATAKKKTTKKKAVRKTASSKPLGEFARRLARPVELEAVPRERLEAMLAAGIDVLECYRVLGRAKSNVVGELLRNQGTFYQWNHYPKGDVYDQDSHAQYFYHAHPTELRQGEHGHFHTFLRAKGIPEGLAPEPYDGKVKWPEGDKALSHLVGISMEPKGFPIRLFATNRWVTGETWYRAEAVTRMLARFLIDHTYPSWATNRWISGMLRLFGPDIEALLIERDRALAEWRTANPERDVYEDRRLEVTSYIDISVEERVRALCALLGEDARSPA